MEMISLLQLDSTVFVWINADWTSPILDVIMPFFSHFGDKAVVWAWIVLIGLLMVLPLAQHFKTGQGSGQQVAMTKAVGFFCLYMALIYLVNVEAYHGLKHFFQRPRPFVQQTAVVRVSSSMALDRHHNDSFPSGHACNAFMIAVLLSERFRRGRYAIYGVASLVALSRVYLGVHYPSDVIVGASLGFSITWLMLFFRPQGNRIMLKNLFPSQT
jgi:undecaprenyl-diphosphatase